MYTIKIDYQTGDSFHIEDCSRTLEANWNLEVAKENLQRIKEHYQIIKDRDNYVSIGSSKETSLMKKIKTERWYVERNFEWSIKLLENDSTEKEYSCFWAGYFETLYGGTIVETDEYNATMSFTI